jgi:hypothetical protein
MIKRKAQRGKPKGAIIFADRRAARDDARVPVAGMSAGIRNQLYPALRMATLEWRLENSEPMPFISRCSPITDYRFPYQAGSPGCRWAIITCRDDILLKHRLAID